jgi:hypothetical protein
MMDILAAARPDRRRTVYLLAALAGVAAGLAIGLAVRATARWIPADARVVTVTPVFGVSPESPTGPVSPHGLAYRITDRGRRAAALDDVPEDFTPVMVRLGSADLATLDSLITAGIVNSRAEGLRWALSRLREHPACAHLQQQGGENDDSATQ